MTPSTGSGWPSGGGPAAKEAQGRNTLGAAPAVDTAVILAAGSGLRMGGSLAPKPKGSAEVGGRSLIERSLDLLRAAGIGTVWIGTGYGAEYYEELRRRSRDLRCVWSERHATTGSLETLYLLREALDAPVLLLESGLLFEPLALDAVLGASTSDAILGSGFTGAGDEVWIEVDDAGPLVNMSKQRSRLGRADAELVGIAKLSPETGSAMCRVFEQAGADGPRLDYEDALVAVGRERPIPVVVVPDLVWCEVDDVPQLERARSVVYPRLASID